MSAILALLGSELNPSMALVQFFNMSIVWGSNPPMVTQDKASKGYTLHNAVAVEHLGTLIAATTNLSIKYVGKQTEENAHLADKFKFNLDIVIQYMHE